MLFLLVKILGGALGFASPLPLFGWLLFMSLFLRRNPRFYLFLELVLNVLFMALILGGGVFRHPYF